MASHGTHANPTGITWNIQDPDMTDRVWAGPSNAGLVDPAQCSLIALTNITGRLIAYTIDQLAEPDEIETLEHQSFALAQLQKLPALMEHAIQTLAAVHAQQESEEQAKAELVNRVVEFLQATAPMKAEDLSARLDIDLQDLTEALDEAVSRGLLIQETHYRTEVAG